jgi:hypothetical protein
MANSKDRLDAAIQAHRARKAEAQQRAAEQERQAREAAQLQFQRRGEWGVTTHATIINAVMNVSNEAARRGSSVLFRLVPTQEALCARFEVHESGSLSTLAKLRFTMDQQGWVSVSTDVRSVTVPSPVQLSDVTNRWADEIARDVLVAMLEHRGVLIKQD